MRTREEQIEEMVGTISDLASNGLCATHKEIERWVKQAEERARAECATDTRRLEWLLSRTHYGIPGFDPKVSGRSPSERKEALIRAIDAAMDVE